MPTLFAVELRIDCSRQTGTIRPLHGVNNGPVNQGELVDLSTYYRELGFPLARLHDSEWPDPEIVDIHAIFPDMSADPEHPESYDFRRTDDYISAIVNAGCGIVYRLGESIEHTQRKYRVHPPNDMDKWAQICIGIIRHYNEGWAGGFRHNIRYWEIWNEPENRPAMWTGTDEQYFQLYVTAAKTIKTSFPDLKVGGPSIGAMGELKGNALKPTEFVKAFLKTCKERQAPLDFFSWHTYSHEPFIYAKKANEIRKLLDEYGFETTEIHLNEWNYLPGNDWRPMGLSGQGIERRNWYDRMGGAEGAAFLACVLSDLQNSPVDVANYYSGDTSLFGLFDRYAAPKKTYYAMKAFRMLLETTYRLETTGWTNEQGTILAGTNEQGNQWTILISYFLNWQQNLNLVFANLPASETYRWRMFVLDAQHDLEPLQAGRLSNLAELTAKFQGPFVLVVRLEREDQGNELINSLGMTLRKIPPGEFQMGRNGNEAGSEGDESPRHKVRLTKGFWIGTMEVTQAEWSGLMRTHPWEEHFTPKESIGFSSPAVCITWQQAAEFCKRLGDKEGRKYRLPTEAEWEYACRAGSTTAFCFGDDPMGLPEYGWCRTNTSALGDNRNHTVGLKRSNVWGLFDMHGNVWEWCSDWYDPKAYPDEEATDPTGPAEGKQRVIRGGSWEYPNDDCGSAERGTAEPERAAGEIGFRIVMETE